MEFLKEFFSKRIFINALFFSIPVSLLLVWRFAVLNHIAILSPAGRSAFFAFVFITYIAYMLLFFVLALLGSRKQEYDEDRE